MRLRQLGKGQSVVFFIPTEVQDKIQELRTRLSPARSQTRVAADMDVLEVLEWSISETIVDLQKSMPLWAVQGERFDRQDTYWNKCTRDKGIEMTRPQAEQFLEDEAATLEYRYSPHPRESVSEESMQNGSSVRLRAIQERCSEVGAPQVDEASLQEEQERELSPEIEEERQIERPPPARPARHSVHPDISAFVSSGRLPQGSSAVMAAFTALRDTSAADFLDVDLFPQDILVTTDFVRTVQRNTTGRFLSDAYQRPVQWILTSQPTNWDTVLVLSPYEANALLPTVRTSKHVTLHVYCARPTREIKPLDDLALFPTPSRPPAAPATAWSGGPFPLRLRVQLNLFAGQLYVQAPDEYAALCRLLRLSRAAACDGVVLAPDGFILSADVAAAAPAAAVHDDEDGAREEAVDVVRTSTFTRSPVKFLGMFLSRSRKDCQSIDKTHLGRILAGELLRDGDFRDGEPDERN